MKSRLLAMTLSFGLMAAPLAFAQNSNSPTGGGGSESGQSDASGNGGTSVGQDASSKGGEDAANYLTGPGARLFYTDETMSTLRSPDEMRTYYNSMAPEDQQVLVRSCASNEDTRFRDLCSAVGTW